MTFCDRGSKVELSYSESGLQVTCRLQTVIPLAGAEIESKQLETFKVLLQSNIMTVEYDSINKLALGFCVTVFTSFLLCFTKLVIHNGLKRGKRGTAFTIDGLKSSVFETPLITQSSLSAFSGTIYWLCNEILICKD